MPGLFPDPVLAALRLAPHRTAIEVDGGDSVTRGQLLRMVWRIAGAMRRAGLRRGTGVCVPPSLTPQAYAAHLAAHALGCRVGAARPAWGPEQLEYALTRFEVVVADRPVAAPGKRVLSLDQLLTGPAVEVRALARPEDPARLIFTSGSTGRPKACTHSYRAMSLAYSPLEWPEPLLRLLTHFQRCLIHQSLAAPVMFTYLGRCLVAGGMAVFSRRTGAELDLAEAIERLRPTATMMPPGRLHEILASGRDLSSLEALMLGGAPASPTLLRTAMARLGPVVWQGYGQGEAGIISMLTPEQIAAGHDDTVGMPVPDVELGFGEDGEIRVRSPHMMDGYWEDPEQTGQVLRDGWLHTRDIGLLDEHGLLHLSGRSRDVIMVNAEVCYAGAIEQVLASHPRVAQSFVVGAPDPMTGEAIHAFVLPAGGQPPPEAELRELVQVRLSANSQPKTITVISSVPLTEAGKPDRSTLRRQAMAR